MNCEMYDEKVPDWESIYSNDTRKQVLIAKETEKRMNMRENKMKEVGQDSSPAPTTPNLFC